MKYILSFLALLVAFLFLGCSAKNYEHTQPKIFVIKSPKLKFADLGYLRNTNTSIELELFVAGTSVEKITINHLICVSKGCMSKSGFNSEYLNASYPDEMLQNILLSEPIYNGLNKVITPIGYEQVIENEYVDIVYRVRQGAAFFRDRKNNISFKHKDTQLRIDDE
ncbi:MAG: hypothetical protein RBR59_07540 [Sulfurimonadaceae bacterium]|jgi:hypothetical protein|nr:hypothetical protein [Sulfurimonadaceae bacterium]